MRPTILIVDDHRDFRRVARSLLEADGFLVVGEAVGADDAMTEVERLRPDVVLLDIALGGVDGLEVATWLAALADPPKVVLISSRDASVYATRLATSPALGFIPKNRLSGAALADLVG